LEQTEVLFEVVDPLPAESPLRRGKFVQEA